MENGRARGRADRWPRRRAAGGLGVVGCAYELSETGAEMDAMRLRLIGEVEARHGARIEVLADATTGERMHVLDPRAS